MRQPEGVVREELQQGQDGHIRHCFECNREEPHEFETKESSWEAKRKELVQGIKYDIESIAKIYPTAFDLYDEPLSRLANRIATRVMGDRP